MRMLLLVTVLVGLIYWPARIGLAAGCEGYLMEDGVSYYLLENNADKYAMESGAGCPAPASRHRKLLLGVG